MKSQQLSLNFDKEEQEEQKVTDIYLNAMGEPLPWETPEYIKLYKKIDDIVCS